MGGYNWRDYADPSTYSGSEVVEDRQWVQRWECPSCGRDGRIKFARSVGSNYEAVLELLDRDHHRASPMCIARGKHMVIRRPGETWLYPLPHAAERRL